MYLVDDVDNRELVKDIILDTCIDLKVKKWVNIILYGNI
jgi:hypothetical protein